MKKFLSLILVLAVLLSFPATATSVSITDGTDELISQFVFGEGPEIDGLSIDYRYFSPVKNADTNKYPLVIWLHGMGDGTRDNTQVKKSNISYWSSEEFQVRFSSGGAFILAARSREEMGHCWDNATVEPLKAAIDEFIAKNKSNIDLTRIYIGGYSMGGKMTLKMAIAFPEMFAAAFPICPAWSPSEELLKNIKNMPLWITSGKLDPLVSYYFSVNKTWEKLCNVTEVPEDCRFSSLSKVCFENGKRTTSSHHAWFSVNHDMFSDTNGKYPHMSTKNALGEDVTLTYPNGMISWLSSHTSDYDGAPTTGMGNLEGAKDTDGIAVRPGLVELFQTIIFAIKDLLGL